MHTTAFHARRQVLLVYLSLFYAKQLLYIESSHPWQENMCGDVSVSIYGTSVSIFGTEE